MHDAMPGSPAGRERERPSAQPADDQDWIVWPDLEGESAWVGALLEMEMAALTRFCWPAG